MKNLPKREPTIEYYLDRLHCCLLIMPFEERYAIREEMRAHILDLVACHEAEGLSSFEAIQKALVAFGDPKAIGRLLADDWREEHGMRRVGNPFWMRFKVELVTACCAIIVVLACVLLTSVMPPFLAGKIPGLGLLTMLLVSRLSRLREKAVNTMGMEYWV